jgi:hypothetical protein
MIVGNPASRRIMLCAYNAHRQHGLSVQGTLAEFRSCEGNEIVKSVFWRDALMEWCHVDHSTAYWMVEELRVAARRKEG